MPRILISATFPETLLARQTPHGAGQWDEFQFIFQPDGKPVDAWVVYDNLRQPITQHCPPANTLLITGEPASVRLYRRRYTGQFGQIWTSHHEIAHPFVSRRNEAQHWHYGMNAGLAHGEPLTFEDLASLAPPTKEKLLSVICSSKTVTENHRLRLEFVRFLSDQLGDKIDVIGSGIRPVSDKSEAIWPYKYHIVLENDHSERFMTEKLPDAFLGWSYPIYSGGTEANYRYPEGSFTAIDIRHPMQALAIINDVLRAGTYEACIERLKRARKLVLWKHNLFAMLADYWRDNLATQATELVTLLPKSHRTGLVLRQIQRSFSRPTATQKVA